MKDEVGEQSGAIGVEKPVEGTPDAVVVELAQLSEGAVQEGGMNGGGPFDDRIKGGTAEDEAAQESAEGMEGIQGGSRVGGREETGEEGRETEALEVMVDDG
jgi:hypothetical protein